MVTVFAMAAGLWGLGTLIGAPKRLRWGMILVLWAAVVVLHLVLPDAAPLRVATGGSVAPWLLLGGAAGIAAAYGRLVLWLRTRAAHVGAVNADDKPLFEERELERYARHIVLRELGGPGQRSLKQARVLVIGAGGLDRRP